MLGCAACLPLLLTRSACFFRCRWDGLCTVVAGKGGPGCWQLMFRCALIFAPAAPVQPLFDSSRFNYDSDEEEQQQEAAGEVQQEQERSAATAAAAAAQQQGRRRAGGGAAEAAAGDEGWGGGGCAAAAAGREGEERRVCEEQHQRRAVPASSLPRVCRWAGGAGRGWPGRAGLMRPVLQPAWGSASARRLPQAAHPRPAPAPCHTHALHTHTHTHSACLPTRLVFSDREVNVGKSSLINMLTGATRSPWCPRRQVGGVPLLYPWRHAGAVSRPLQPAPGP